MSVAHTSHTWRHIDSAASSGSLNMAVDEALLLAYDPEHSEPILRTYGWKPPTLSLGRFQKSDEVLDLERCFQHFVPVVRRISGGGVIYHADELTYSIVCSSRQIPPADSIKDSFRILTGFLMEFYRMLGLNSCYAVDAASETDQLGYRTAFCFAGREAFDILIDGRKIGGNAQRRYKNVIFQHGSIPILNQARLGLQYMKDQSPEYAEKAGSLCDCGVTANITVLKRLFVETFSRHMGVEIRLCSLTQEEQRVSKKLLADKYTSERWNLQGVMT